MKNEGQSVAAQRLLFALLIIMVRFFAPPSAPPLSRKASGSRDRNREHAGPSRPGPSRPGPWRCVSGWGRKHTSRKTHRAHRRARCRKRTHASTRTRARARAHTHTQIEEAVGARVPVCLRTCARAARVRVCRCARTIWLAVWLHICSMWAYRKPHRVTYHEVWAGALYIYIYSVYINCMLYVLQFELALSLSLSLYIYIYIYAYICLYLLICINTV